jgi:hypothetical protein
MRPLSRRAFVTRLAATLPMVRSIQLPVAAPPVRTVRLAVVADVHQGLAPDALTRLDAFLAAVVARDRLDAVWQLGDFCYSDAESQACLDRWRTVTLPRFGVLGNHDMDKVDKAVAVAAFGMTARYYATVLGGWRFVVLDLNHFRKDGEIHAYATGNYFTDNATFNLADPEQLVWLERELRASREPVVLISHQPIGFGSAGDLLPEEQRQVPDVIEAAGRDNPAGRVVCCLSGHLHIDRFETPGGLPCLSVNSASYYWSNGMYPYTQPLFAFMDFGSDGMLTIEGRAGAFVRRPPADSDAVTGRSASIASRSIRMPGRLRIGS